MRRYVAFAACMSLLVMVWPLRWATAVPASPPVPPSPPGLAAAVPVYTGEPAGPDRNPAGPNLLSAPLAEAFARALLPIPAGLPVRESAYHPENPYRPLWSLVFAPVGLDSRTGEFHVDVDARTGQITRYLTTAPLAESPALTPVDPEQPQAASSRFPYEEGRKLAEDLLRRLAPGEASAMKLLPQPPLSTVFRYPFGRMEQGLPVVSLDQDEGAVILLDSATGALRSYELRWTDSIAFPPATPKVTTAQAAATWLNKVGFELRYRLHRSQVGDEPATVTLEYGPAIREQPVFVDGLTGDLVWGTELLRPAVTPQPVLLKASAPAAPRLSPLNETDAIAFVRRYLPVPADQSPVTRLVTDEGGAPTWELEWPATEEQEARTGSVRVTVDAQRGLLLQYTRLLPTPSPDQPANLPDQPAAANELQTPPPQLTRPKALALAVTFVEGLPPAPWRLRLVPDPEPTPDPSGLTDFLMPSYTFLFEPLIGGVPVYPAAVRVWVTANGEVESYQVDQALRTAYPPADGALRPDEIARAFTQSGGTLQPYFHVSVTTHTATLLYRVQSPAGLLFHPYTGAPIDGEGLNLSHLVHPPQDLSGHWAEPEINLAIALKLILPDRGRFAPDQPLSRKDAANLLIAFGKAAGESLQSPHPLPKASAALLLQTQPALSPDGPISRGEFAVMLARFLGLADIAAVPTQMQLSFSDGQSIPPEWRNHVALASGTGLMVGYADNSWRPNAPLTRAMAAVVISRITRGWLTAVTS